MPIDLGVWRIDNGLDRLSSGALELESRLEEILDGDIGLVSPAWMVVGRQVATAYGKFIDLLAIDSDGNLHVLELESRLEDDFATFQSTVVLHATDSPAPSLLCLPRPTSMVFQA